MKAVIVEAHGPYDAHSVKEVEPPALKPGHVRIQVRAAGVNFPDLLIVQNKYQFKPDLPFSPGGECAGVVTELGEGATGVAVGDRVFASAPFGMFAQEVMVPAEACHVFPEEMSFEEASAINLVYGTSYYALKNRAQLKPGETLLVLGAAGGVGLAAVELGKAMGARVIAAASSDEKLAICRAHGADLTLNYGGDVDLKEAIRDVSGGGVDVVYDPVGDRFSEAAFRCLNWEGRHLVIGFAAGEIPKLPLNLALLKSADLRGVFWGAWTRRDPEGHRRNTAEYLQMYVEGKIRPRISNTYPIEDFVKAFDEIAERRAMGKVVLTMG